jgi:hypothetical protein
MELKLRLRSSSVDLDPERFGHWETAMIAVHGVVNARENGDNDSIPLVAALEARYPRLASLPTWVEQDRFLVHWMNELYQVDQREEITPHGYPADSGMVRYSYGLRPTASLDSLSAPLIPVICDSPWLHSIFSVNLLMRIHSTLGDRIGTADRALKMRRKM